MHVQILNFQLDGIDEEGLFARYEKVATTFAEFPGLLWKIWLRSPDSAVYGGVYAWESEDAYEAFMASDLFRAVAENPNFIDVTSTDFGIVEGPTRVTRGLETVAATPG